MLAPFKRSDVKTLLLSTSFKSQLKGNIGCEKSWANECTLNGLEKTTGNSNKMLIFKCIL